MAKAKTIESPAVTALKLREHARDLLIAKGYDRPEVHGAAWEGEELVIIFTIPRNMKQRSARTARVDPDGMMFVEEGFSA